jgi:hypothetical protein
MSVQRKISIVDGKFVHLTPEVKSSPIKVKNWAKMSDRAKVHAYVGRKNRSVPSTLHGSDGSYGNPFIIGRDGTREDVIEKFEAFISSDAPKAKEMRKKIQSNLRGLTLACWCGDKPCHGTIIARIANSTESTESTVDQ